MGDPGTKQSCGDGESIKKKSGENKKTGKKTKLNEKKGSNKKKKTGNLRDGGRRHSKGKRSSLKMEGKGLKTKSTNQNHIKCRKKKIPQNEPESIGSPRN